MTRRCAGRSCARCAPMIWTRRTGRCGCGRRPPRPGGSGWCRTRRRPGLLLAEYLRHRAVISRARGPLFLSESRRNHAEPLSLWSWSKVVRRAALAAEVPRFSTHTTRHLCLTDLARMGWEVHAIATFAGHRSTDSTLRYIHLSGRELPAKLNSSMAQIHAWRVEHAHRARAAAPGGAGRDSRRARRRAKPGSTAAACLASSRPGVAGTAGASCWTARLAPSPPSARSGCAATGRPASRGGPRSTGRR